MSARAAWRLETLGFPHVYRYDAGKDDWSAAGLPLEGKERRLPRAGDIARRDVPTCRLTERIGDVRARVHPTGWETCLVTNDAGVVLGRLGKHDLDAVAHADEAVETRMAPGPVTLRPDVPLAELVLYLREHDLQTAPVTTPDGVLVGLVLREVAEHRFHETHAAARGAGTG